MRYAVIAQLVPTYPVVHWCRALAVSPSGYDAWKRRQPSQRQQHDERLGASNCADVSEKSADVWQSAGAG